MQNLQTPQSETLANVTRENIGKDLSPTQDAFGCAETVCTLTHLAFSDTWKTLSTKELYDHLFISPAYAKVTVPLAGDIIVSPTGLGNGRIANGHTGVVQEGGLIASNDSYTSKLELNYNLESWAQRYGVVGGFPIAYFRRIQS